jgi:23S rRNA (uracil1939-C5)-methyltransferase
MKKNERIELDIVSMHEDGFGLTADRKHGVYGSLPGESVVSAPITRKRKMLFSRVESIVHPSEFRVEARCSAADFCGGCSYQHVAHDAQLRFKQEQLQEEFELCQPDNWLPPLSGDPFHYRSKARLGVKFVDKKGRVLVGFREKKKPYIAEIDDCHVLREPVATLLAPLSRLIEKLSIVRSLPQIEVAIGDTETALVFRNLEALSGEDEQLLCQFGEDEGVHLYLQPGSPESTHKFYPDDDLDRLSYSLPDYGLSFRFHPLDFTQVNPAINRKMVNLALSLLELSETDRVLDAFCGIGNFSLAISRTATSVLGLENSEASIERARENADANGITNTQFEIADLFADQNELPGINLVNKVLVDPPRTGALELCEKLATTDVERVVYVSCNPKTLARDAQILVKSGFQLRQLGIIDMFPHTTHVESIALFTR